MAEGARAKNLGRTLPLVTFHTEILRKPQRMVLESLGPFVNEAGFYLGGGTAVALRLGHRQSDDFDWFTQARLPDAEVLVQRLQGAHLPFILGLAGKGALHGTLQGVRVSFLEYRYPALEEPTAWRVAGCKVASLQDLAPMKLAAVAHRGSRRDFLDLHAMVRSGLELKTMLALYKKKYGTKEIAHLLCALVYFDDAEKEKSPRMYQKLNWSELKKDFGSWVREIAKT